MIFKHNEQLIKHLFKYLGNDQVNLNTFCWSKFAATCTWNTSLLFCSYRTTLDELFFFASFFYNTLAHTNLMLLHQIFLCYALNTLFFGSLSKRECFTCRRFLNCYWNTLYVYDKDICKWFFHKSNFSVMWWLYMVIYIHIIIRMFTAGFLQLYQIYDHFCV